MKTKRKTFKVVGIVLSVSFLAAIILSTWGRDDYRFMTEEDSQKVVDAMNKEYAEDPYGGTTPEETLKLFTDALKNGDTALAAKYFLPEDREAQFLRLENIKRAEKSDIFLHTIDARQLEELTDVLARYVLTAPDGLGSPCVLVKIINGRWKIRTL